MKAAIHFIFLLLPVWAGAQPQTAPAKSNSCIACHGEKGLSPNPLWPNLAGQKAGYLEKQLRAFRDGTRVDPLMTPFSQTLSETDIRSLAAYFASLKGAP